MLPTCLRKCVSGHHTTPPTIETDSQSHSKVLHLIHSPATVSSTAVNNLCHSVVLTGASKHDHVKATMSEPQFCSKPSSCCYYKKTDPLMPNSLPQPTPNHGPWN
ncbi:hypothetical protein CMV_002400 [Castanea mollissima]|uniref:Uncharacterized protein n=1 Tax=Castanea mollissima TaxID=60419 RepID=A0A8J4RQA0_9ROSI|nr:hypothetical protein CMV_002400 [Castanea mollissima]